MIFLPIVERELRVASRQRGTYWMRIGAALIALIIGAWVMLMPSFRNPRLLGGALFVSLAVFTYLYCLLAGLRTTSDCLSEEKREGTLGLLFLTDLKGYDIVLGKLAATSLNAFYGLLAVVPVMAIPLLLGGVAVQEFWRVVMCCLNNLFFSLAVGMLCSSISKDERKAMFATLLLIVFFTGGLPLLGALLTIWTKSRLPAPIFFVPSPGYMSFMAFDDPFRGLRGQFNFFYGSLLCVHLLSWAFLVTACLVVPRTWQDKAESPARLRRKARLSTWKYGHARSRRAFRLRLLEVNPVYWITSRDRLKPMLVWEFLAMGGLVWLWGIWKYPRDWLQSECYVMTALLVHSVLKIWILSEACRQLALDRKSGALELLLSTPIQVKEIVRGQLAGLQRQFLVPSALVLLVDFLFLYSRNHNSDWIVMWGAGMVMFGLDMVVLSWLGMWTGLKTGRPAQAVASVAFLNLILPWLVFGLTMTLLEVTSLGRALNRLTNRFGNGHQDTVILGIWFAIGLAFDAALWALARHGLLRHLRTVAAQKVRTRFQAWFSSRPAPAARQGNPPAVPINPA
jgi:ABC-type transport system involved in multi-copper enzyme maturation permease subunit